MGLLTLEGVVKDGQIQLNTTIDLPENTKVYVIFPEIRSSGLVVYPTGRLVRPDLAEQFTPEVIDISDEWSEEDLKEFSAYSMRHMFHRLD
jgi:hypothetical protein